eukprot:m.153727 g.153727  ORF g.153727 m.153727 type:complete len:884 (-) comp15072_c0_seq1:1663-4314(-)
MSSKKREREPDDEEEDSFSAFNDSLCKLVTYMRSHTNDSCFEKRIAFESPAQARRICNYVAPGLWESLERMTQKERGPKAQASHERYLFGLLLSFTFAMDPNLRCLPLNFSDWFLQNRMTPTSHRCLSHLLPWVQDPHTARQHRRNDKQKHKVPRKFERQISGVIFTDELVRRYMAKYERKDVVLFQKGTHSIRWSKNSCNICEQFLGRKICDSLRSKDFQGKIHSDNILEPIQISLVESSVLKTVCLSETYAEISQENELLHGRGMALQHWLSGCTDESKIQQLVKRFEESKKGPSSGLVPLAYHFRFEDVEVVHFTPEACNGMAFNEKHLWELFRKQQPREIIDIHVADMPITEAVIRSMHNKSGGLYPFRDSIIPFYGCMHTAMSFTRYTAKTFSFFIFKLWRIQKKVFFGKEDNAQTHENIYLRKPYRSFGYQLSEFLELYSAWHKIKGECRKDLDFYCEDDMYLYILRHIMEENIPLCLDLIKAMKSGNLLATCKIFERLSGRYIWMNRHTVYQRATLYMATLLRRLINIGGVMVDKLQELLPAAVDAHVERFFGFLVEHMPRHRGRIADNEMLRVADSIPSVVKNNSAAEEMCDVTHSERYSLNFNPETKTPSEDICIKAEHFLRDLFQNHKQYVNLVATFDRKGNCSGCECTPLSVAGHMESIPIGALPLCAQFNDRIQICCLCAEILDNVIDKKTILHLSCGHLAHATCIGLKDLMQITASTGGLVKSLYASELREICFKLNTGHPLKLKQEFAEHLYWYVRKGYDETRTPACKQCNKQLILQKKCLACTKILTIPGIKTSTPGCFHEFHPTCVKEQDIVGGKLKCCPVFLQTTKEKLKERALTCNKTLTKPCSNNEFNEYLDIESDSDKADDES